MGALFFLTTPHYFIVLLRYSASQLVLFFLRHIVMAVWQAHRGGKLLGVAIWILEAIPGSIKTLTLAKSLVSLSYYADGVGKGCSRRGTQAGWGFRSAAASRSSRAWLRWGMVVKNVPGWDKKSLGAITKGEESVPLITRQALLLEASLNNNSRQIVEIEFKNKFTLFQVSLKNGSQVPICAMNPLLFFCFFGHWNHSSYSYGTLRDPFKMNFQSLPI